ncbi:hypothetical protein RB195_007498 [Necator americanus]
MEPHAVPVVPISFYITGTMLNFFLLYVYWHWYWHVASLWGSAVRVHFGQIVRNANNRSRRDRPRLPKERMEFPQPLEVDRLVTSSMIPESFQMEVPSAGAGEMMPSHDSNVSLIFREVREAQMNGEVLKGMTVMDDGASTAERPVFFLEVPATSRTVRARYPHEPPVIKAIMKRGMEDVVTKQLDVAAKRALYRKKASNREATIDQDSEETLNRSRKSISNLGTLDVTEEELLLPGRSSTTTRKSLTNTDPRAEQTNQKTSKKSRKTTNDVKIKKEDEKEKSKVRRVSITPKKSITQLPNGPTTSNKKIKDVTKRRQSILTADQDHEERIKSLVPASELSTPSTPPMPIIATRVAPDAVENRMLKVQEDFLSKRQMRDDLSERKPRRLLPKTPDEHPSGEISRAKFYLQNSDFPTDHEYQDLEQN